MNRWLVAGGLLLCGLILFSFTTAGAWGGADGAAGEKVDSIDPEYEPWFESLWVPPSGEIESLLFSLQAAIGGLIIGYYVGRVSPLQSASETP